MLESVKDQDVQQGYQSPGLSLGTLTFPYHVEWGTAAGVAEK